MYEDFQFKAMFHIVSQDNTVQSQPLFQERLCIISVCVRARARTHTRVRACVGERGGERERDVSLCLCTTTAQREMT